MSKNSQQNDTVETMADDVELNVQESSTEELAAEKPMNDDAMNDHIKGAIEALLFVNERPISLEQLKKVLKTVGAREIKAAITEMQDACDARRGGINIIEIAGGYQLLTNQSYATYIRDFYKTKHKEKLSKPSLESLAIIAYKQPVTRADIEVIRGVNSDGVVNHLLTKELIKIVGRKDIPGKPYLYGTTKQFMEYFGLKSLDDLPKLEEFAQLQPAYEQAVIDSESLAEDEPSIPKDAIPMNSLEQVKQSAIKIKREEVNNKEPIYAEEEQISEEDGQQENEAQG